MLYMATFQGMQVEPQMSLAGFEPTMVTGKGF